MYYCIKWIVTPGNILCFNGDIISILVCPVSSYVCLHWLQTELKRPFWALPSESFWIRQHSWRGGIKTKLIQRVATVIIRVTLIGKNAVGTFSWFLFPTRLIKTWLNISVNLKVSACVYPTAIYDWSDASPSFSPEYFCNVFLFLQWWWWPVMWGRGGQELLALPPLEWSINSRWGTFQAVTGCDRVALAGSTHIRHQTLGVNKSWYQEYFVTSWHFNYLWLTVLGNIPDRKATL